MHNFTPLASLSGGILIGLAAGAVLLLDGGIAGISGILAGVMRPRVGRSDWRGWFLAGLVGGGVLLRWVAPASFNFTLDRSVAALIVAGLLVGIGTRMANGCTSGHGVCGVSRLSARSVVATLTFLATGVV